MRLSRAISNEAVKLIGLCVVMNAWIMTFSLVGAAPLPMDQSSAAQGSWQILQQNMASFVFGVDFVDSRIGYFAGLEDGYGSIAYKTIDGGVTVKVQNVAPLHAACIAVASSSNTSAMIAGVGAFGFFKGLSYTSDGETWKHSPDDDYIISIYNDVKYVDKNYIITGTWATLLETFYGVAFSGDEGRTLTYYEWTPAEESPRYSSFLNRNVGYVAGGHWPVAASSDIFGSKDGISISARIRIPMVKGMKSNPNGNVQNTDYRAVISKTTDGGRTWRVLVDESTDYYFQQISFVDENRGWVLSDGAQVNRILATTDGGLSWTTQYTTSGFLTSLEMVDENEGWAGGYARINPGGSALILRTTNGGRTWEPMPLGINGVVMRISVVDANNVWATVKDLTTSRSAVVRFVPSRA